MAIDQETRRNIRRNLFSSVGELADIAFQRATWLDPDMQNPHFSYVEFAECFYDAATGSYDDDDPDAEEAPLRGLVEFGYISEEEQRCVWPLHLALKDYRAPNNYDQEAILGDPKWHLVCETAAEAKAALMDTLNDRQELACFENRLPSSAAKRWP